MAGGDSCPSPGPVPAAGQHNDARMNLAIALTAARYGAATANYAEVLRLLKTMDPGTGKERVCGARCRDVLTGVCVTVLLAEVWDRGLGALCPLCILGAAQLVNTTVLSSRRYCALAARKGHN